MLSCHDDHEGSASELPLHRLGNRRRRRLARRQGLHLHKVVDCLGDTIEAFPLQFKLFLRSLEVSVGMTLPRDLVVHFLELELVLLEHPASNQVGPRAVIFVVCDCPKTSECIDFL